MIKTGSSFGGDLNDKKQSGSMLKSQKTQVRAPSQKSIVRIPTDNQNEIADNVSLLGSIKSDKLDSLLPTIITAHVQDISSPAGKTLT